MTEDDIFQIFAAAHSKNTNPERQWYVGWNAALEFLEDEIRQQIAKKASGQIAIDRTMRHPNGGALKIGTEVHVSADSFCDEKTVISGRSSVFHSTILYGRDIESCQVFNSDLRYILARGSVFAESTCEGLRADDAILYRVKTEMSVQGQCEPMRLIGVVAENCELYGNWTLEGNARIPCGIWHRAPRFLRITGPAENGIQIDVGLTESTDNHALMACWRKPITQWLKAGPRLGRLHGWTAAQIQAAKEFYEELADVRMEGVRV